FAESVRSRFLRVPDVAKVELMGVQPEKIFLEAPQQRLAQMGLNINELVAQLNAQNGIEGAGFYYGGQDNVQMRVTGEFRTVEQIRQMPIRAVNPATGQARTVRLGDVAQVRRAYQTPPSTKVRHQGKDVIAIGISMTKGGDIIALGEALRAEATAVHADLPVGIELDQIQNQPSSVKTSVNDFVTVLLEAIVVVLAVSFVSLGLHPRPWRLDVWPGLVVAISIPLVLALTF